METQYLNPKPKQSKRYASTVTVPEEKANIFREVVRGRELHRISRSHRVEQVAIREVIKEGFREMNQTAPLPRFRGFVDGFGKRKPISGSVVMMPARREGTAA